VNTKRVQFSVWPLSGRVGSRSGDTRNAVAGIGSGCTSVSASSLIAASSAFMRRAPATGVRGVPEVRPQALKELGCKFALDDFGTGLSSFGYLKHFPVDFLKIDGSFVKGVLHIHREMVRSINEIGHLTGKQTIAEWAENAEIIEALRASA
jgi:EAL domain